MTLVRYESAGHVATITMDRASAHNAPNPALCEELCAAWLRFRDSDDRVAVLASATPRSGIYLGKWCALMALLIAVELVLLPLVALFFQMPLEPGDALGIRECRRPAGRDHDARPNRGRREGAGSAS